MKSARQDRRRRFFLIWDAQAMEKKKSPAAGEQAATNQPGAPLSGSFASFPSIVHRSGEPLHRIGPNYVFAWGDVVDFNFDSGGGGGWEEQAQQFTPADPWEIASVSLVGWELRFHGDSASDVEDHEVHNLGVLPWITINAPPLLEVHCRALIRDAKTGHRWNGSVRVLVSYYRQPK